METSSRIEIFKKMADGAALGLACLAASAQARAGGASVGTVRVIVYYVPSGVVGRLREARARKRSSSPT